MNVIQFEKVGAFKEGEVFEWNIPGWVLIHKYSTKRSDLFTLSRFPDFTFCMTLRPYLDEFTNAVSFNLDLYRIPVVKCDSNTNTENLDTPVLNIDVRFILLKLDAVYKWSGVMKMGDNRITAKFPEVSTYDCLNIQCIIIYPPSSSESPVSVSQEETTTEETKHGLVHDFSSLLNSGSLSDVTLRVQDKEFKAHRCVLAARSTVFSAMFNHDLKEKLENRIVISDIDSDGIQQLLKYVYTDEIDELTTQQYLTLLAAADKYDIVGLRKKCVFHLKKNLTVDGLIPILVTADLQRESDLKEAAIQFFLKNSLTIMKSDDWLSCMKNHTELANSILLRLAKK